MVDYNSAKSLEISLTIAAAAIAADAVDANPGYERLQPTGYLVK